MFLLKITVAIAATFLSATAAAQYYPYYPGYTTPDANAYLQGYAQGAANAYQGMAAGNAAFQSGFNRPPPVYVQPVQPPVYIQPQPPVYVQPVQPPVYIQPQPPVYVVPVPRPR